MKEAPATLSEIGAPIVKGSTRRFSVDAPGVTLSAVVLGEETAPPLLVLHGGPGEAHDVLRPHLDALAGEKRRVVFYDQRAGGASALAPGTALPVFDDHVLDALRVSEVCGAVVDVLGFSFGALVALSLAARRPDRVRSLVLVSPARVTAGSDPSAEGRLARSMARPELRLFGSLLSDPAWRSELTRAERHFFGRVAPYLSRPSDALLLAPVACNEAARASVFESLGRYDFSPELARVRCPALVLHGSDDPLPPASSEALAERLGAHFVRMEGAGHAPFAEQNARFLELVSAFLDEPR